jgi:uncharacterized protein YndB with AHSA1/START domain
VRKVALYGLGVVALVLLAVQVVGMLLPREHVATSRARYAQPREAVWKAITDHARMTEWRTGLTRVERLDDEDGKPVWREESSFGPMRMRVDVAEEPARYVTTIADPELPFGGSWTYVLEESGGSCRLTITEDGFIEPGFFRFLARFVFGYDATRDQYMRDLGAKFGEPVEPQHVKG